MIVMDMIKLTQLILAYLVVTGYAFMAAWIILTPEVNKDQLWMILFHLFLMGLGPYVAVLEEKSRR